MVIQRGLILLTNHLESFRRRYAFHMRNWQLDGQGISSHQKSLQDKNSLPIRVVLQPAGSSEKVCIWSFYICICILVDKDIESLRNANLLRFLHKNIDFSDLSKFKDVISDTTRTYSSPSPPLGLLSRPIWGIAWVLHIQVYHKI